MSLRSGKELGKKDPQEKSASVGVNEEEDPSIIPLGDSEASTSGKQMEEMLQVLITIRNEQTASRSEQKKDLEAMRIEQRKDLAVLQTKVNKLREVQEAADVEISRRFRDMSTDMDQLKGALVERVERLQDRINEQDTRIDNECEVLRHECQDRHGVFDEKYKRGLENVNKEVKRIDQELVIINRKVDASVLRGSPNVESSDGNRQLGNTIASVIDRGVSNESLVPSTCVNRARSLTALKVVTSEPPSFQGKMGESVHNFVRETRAFCEQHGAILHLEDLPALLYKGALEFFYSNREQFHTVDEALNALKAAFGLPRMEVMQTLFGTRQRIDEKSAVFCDRMMKINQRLETPLPQAELAAIILNNMVDRIKIHLIHIVCSNVQTLAYKATQVEELVFRQRGYKGSNFWPNQNGSPRQNGFSPYNDAPGMSSQDPLVPTRSLNDCVSDVPRENNDSRRVYRNRCQESDRNHDNRRKSPRRWNRTSEGRFRREDRPFAERSTGPAEVSSEPNAHVQFVGEGHVSSLRTGRGENEASQSK